MLIKICCVLLLCPVMSTLPHAFQKRIVNGREAIAGQFFWQAAITFDGDDTSWFCGGSIISAEWTLTAGHCVDRAIRAKIVVGANNVFIPAEEFILHENYNSTIFKNDIGLIKLSRAIRFGAYQGPIALGSSHVGSGNRILISGFGVANYYSDDLTRLSFAVVTSISNNECGKFYNEFITETTLCARSSDRNQSPCIGDSGGPAVLVTDSDNPVQVAVISFVSSLGCDSPEPSGYTRIEYYTEWIRNYTGILTKSSLNCNISTN